MSSVGKKRFWLNPLIIAGLLAVSFFAVTLGLALSGRPASALYQSLVRAITGVDLTRVPGARGWFSLRYPGEWLVSSMPLILSGMSMAFAFRTGLWNIGAEGQYIMGMTLATVVALFAPQIPGLHMILAILVACLGGAAWGLLAGWLRVKFKVSEVVTTIMLNYVALFASRIILLRLPGSNTFQTAEFPATVLLNSAWMRELSGNSRLNGGLFFTIFAVVIYSLILSRSVFGFRLQASGLNPEAAAACGIRVAKNRLLSMLIAGSFAGLAGAIVALGSFSYGRILQAMDGIGFAGITVALVGNGSAAGIVLAGLLFGALSNAQPLLQLKSVPRDIVDVISGIIVLLIAFRPGLQQQLLLKLERRRLRKASKKVIN